MAKSNSDRQTGDKPPGWFSRRHQTNAEHNKAVEHYKATHNGNRHSQHPLGVALLREIFTGTFVKQ